MLIELNNITKIFDIDKEVSIKAVDSVNLKIEKGETVAIMGASGSGKSTLLNIMGGLEVASSGQYLFDNVDISTYKLDDLAKHRGDHIGFVLQNYALLNNESVYNNIKMPLLFSSKCPYKAIKNKVCEVAKIIGIEDLLKRKIKRLSGGQKQRVAIARALVNDPEVILADEPTGALDSKTANEIMDVILELNHLGKTIIMVTHDANMAAKMNRTINIVDGKIVE